jgi:hypothetical protein
MSRVLLIDVDSKIPNLALMKLSSWHKTQGDQVALGYMKKPDKVYASSVFSWSDPENVSTVYPDAILGGTGVDLHVSLLPEVESMKPDYQLYSEKHPTWQGIGLGFLQRGCIRNCEFCIVPKKEGKPKVVATLDDLVNPDWQDHWKRPFIVLLDNNFLSLGKWTLDTLDEMAERQYDICFSQGLDIRLVTEELAHKLAKVRFWNLKHSGQQVTFAYDAVEMENLVRKGVSLLHEAGIGLWQLQFFVLCGFNTTLEEDLYRIDVIRSLGADPYVMPYRDPETGTVKKELRHLARWVNKRIYKSCKWDDYKAWAQLKNQQQFDW